jgi:hypothetical protein|tara:strand:- start:111 stop:431 length:321 start_codon:yes stop_codon:yes gene_type:complete
MSDDEEEEELIHEMLLPDNTFAVLFHYNKGTNTVEVFLGDFASKEVHGTKEHDTLCVIGTAVEEMLEIAIKHAMEELNEGIEVETPCKVSKIEGNIIHANFSKEIH